MRDPRAFDRDRHALVVRAQSTHRRPDDLTGYRRDRALARRRARWRGRVARWGGLLVLAGALGLVAWVR